MRGTRFAENLRRGVWPGRGVCGRVSQSLSFGIFFNRGFARVSPVFAAGLLSLLLAVLCCGAAFADAAAARSGSDPTAAVKRQSASAQFTRAQDQRDALNNKAPEKRTLEDYKQVVNSYRRVYLITPHAVEVPDALLAVAELYSEMGERFGRSYFQSAVDTYQFLMREYPTSKYCQDAYLRSAKLQKDELGDLAGASQAYDTFLKKFPRSARRREVMEARAELALLQNTASGKEKATIARNAGAESAPAKSATAENASPKRSASESAITRSAGTEPSPPGAAEAGKSAAASRESATARGTETVTDNAGTPVETGGAPEPGYVGRAPLVRKISATTGKNSTRVTIDLDGSVQYASGRIANPDRIYFDLHAARLTPQLAHARISTDGTALSAVRVAQNPGGVVRVVLDVSGVVDYSASLLNHPSRLVIDLYTNGQPIETAKASEGAAAAIATATEKPVEKTPEKVQPALVAANSAKTSETKEGTDPIPQPKNKLATANVGKANGGKPDLVQPASTPQPTRNGQSTLTRALGLKIGRIVIDPGHGGHDTGTIGPTGLMEKDLCLDVALRLGKIIQQRLPGADVVLTRSDDTFIPLEERTHIANEAKADMFISIHANSSPDTGARGIETYYLNLKGSDEAMEVAARENATSDQGIHELQDLVKQIARTEKIDESKEFAADVQDSLSKRVQKAARTVRNRGVRKAPFVVLIGADMPSILTEISFLSNPADEKMLKQPEHRQRVAEGIYQGVAAYLQSLNSMGMTQANAANPAPKRTTTSAAVESTRDRN